MSIVYAAFPDQRLLRHLAANRSDAIPMQFRCFSDNRSARFLTAPKPRQVLAKRTGTDISNAEIHRLRARLSG